MRIGSKYIFTEESIDVWLRKKLIKLLKKLIYLNFQYFFILTVVVSAGAATIFNRKETMDNIKYKTRKRKGKKQYYWTYEDPCNGKQTEIASFDLKKLQLKVKQKLKQLSLGPRATVPFGDYITTYFNEVHSNRLGTTSQERYRYVLEKIKHFDIANVPMAELDDRRMQGFYNEVFEKTDSASQVSEIHKLVRPCIRYAAIRGDIKADFMPLVTKPRDRDEKRRAKFIKQQNRALTIDEETKISSYLRQGVKREREASTCMMLLIMLYMGLRVGEASILTWQDIKSYPTGVTTLDVNKKANYLQVMQPDGTYRRQLVIGPPKSLSGFRELAIPKDICEILSNYRNWQKAKYQELYLPWDEQTLCFGTINQNGEVGKVKERQNVNRALKLICEKIGIRKHSSHDMRHTFATRAFESGLTIRDVQDLMGDSSTEMLSQIYIHVSKQRRLYNMQKVAYYRNYGLSIVASSEPKSSGISRVSS